MKLPAFPALIAYKKKKFSQRRRDHRGVIEKEKMVVLRFTAIILFFAFSFVISCKSTSKGSTKTDPDIPYTTAQLRSLVEQGSPSALSRMAELLSQSPLSSEADISLTAAASLIARIVYPELSLRFVQTSGGVYGDIIREVERKQYTAPSADTKDLLEVTLPFLALYTELSVSNPNKDMYQTALASLERVTRQNNSSVMLHLFRGFALEKTGNIHDAQTAYKRSLDLDKSCYPAELGQIRLLYAQGKLDEALSRLQPLFIQYPGSPEIRKQLARCYAAKQDWQAADPLVAEIIRTENRNEEFLLIRARILLDKRLYQQAQGVLDTLASINNSSRQISFLRARLQAEGLRNRAAAINVLRPLNRADPDDAEAAVYLAGLLLESNRSEEIEEGRALLGRFVSRPEPPAEVWALTVQDNIRREKWQEAKAAMDRLLIQRQNRGDLLNAWRIERSLGNNAAALTHARELYHRGNTNTEETMAYILSLIDAGHQAEAAGIIDERVGTVPGGPEKSRYYFLRSLLRGNEDSLLNDLRSALFEDPRNVDALIAIFEVYHRKNDERRAVYYLKQALAIAPNNPQLLRYKLEYAHLLGN